MEIFNQRSNISRRRDYRGNQDDSNGQDGYHNGLSSVTGKGASMVCDICGKEDARIRYVTRSYGKGENLLIIDNIPVVSCPHCGESYLTAETLHDIERIKLHRQSFATKRQVAIAEFV